MELVRWFNEIRIADAPLVGGKGANLGELTLAGLPVPPGFAVTAEAYRYAVASAQIADALAALLAGVNAKSTADLIGGRAFRLRAEKPQPRSGEHLGSALCRTIYCDHSR